MKHSIQKSVLLSALSVSGIIVTFSPQNAKAGCQDAHLTIVENDTSESPAQPAPKLMTTPKPQPPTPPTPAKSATIALRCVGGTYSIPGMSLTQIYEPKGNQLCYRDYSCGNVKSWGAYVAVSGTWVWYDSVSKVLEESADTITWKNDFKGGSLSASLALEWGQITRSCRPNSEELCL